jgi:Tfp pilus assembly protein PilF
VRPDASETIMARGFLAYLGHRDWTRATAEFEKIIRLQPNNAEAFWGLASIQKRQGLWLASLANLRKALQLDPGSWAIAFDLEAIRKPPLYIGMQIAESRHASTY